MFWREEPKKKHYNSNIMKKKNESFVFTIIKVSLENNEEFLI
jgi:hypothetical protein